MKSFIQTHALSDARVNPLNSITQLFAAVKPLLALKCRKLQFFPLPKGDFSFQWAQKRCFHMLATRTTQCVIAAASKPTKKTSGDFAEACFRFCGSSCKPLQPEPPSICSRFSNLIKARGGPGGSIHFCFPPAALRRFRRAKAASGKRGTRMPRRFARAGR